ncbi:hypothetical protein H4R19_006953 [Coemansia spiralis]|nr:hypothetical protein H4R19_006953 [Coemansia spiralis]
MAAAESRRLRGLIGRLESQAQATATELLETRQKHAQLQEHCDVRAGQDDAIHQDIAHVLDQISRLRARVVQLESEKAAFETEAGTLRQRCRELEGESAEQAVQLIVERIGKRDWERRRDAAEATAPAAETSSTASADPTPPSQFSSAGTVAICHPEASDIRAEFNELLHQVIGRRDEDIERMRALADAWRADARRALRANELRTWNSGTRGTQTVSDP